MPKTHKFPRYRRHKASGLAVVTLNGRDFYLGPHGSEVSRAEYDRLLAEWLAGGRRIPLWETELTVNELVLSYLDYAETHYRLNGHPSSEVARIKEAVRPLLDLYGHTLAVDFGPRALVAVRERMIQKDWCRKHINTQVSRIRRLFKWAVASEILPAPVHQALQAVEGLRIGRSPARESKPVEPVPEAHVEAVLPLVSRPVAALVRLQLLTGMRPGEAVAMRLGDLDCTGKIWVYTPGSHKTAHHGHSRTVYLGPRAQKLLKPFLKLDPEAYLFSPREAETQRLEDRSRKRKTKRWPSHLKRNARKRKTVRKQPPGGHYTTASYRRAIVRACKTAKIPAWHPHQLRHSAGTRLRKEYGLDVARAVLGHRTHRVTEIYAELDGSVASQAMAKIG